MAYGRLSWPHKTVSCCLLEHVGTQTSCLLTSCICVCSVSGVGTPVGGPCLQIPWRWNRFWPLWGVGGPSCFPTPPGCPPGRTVSKDHCSEIQGSIQNPVLCPLPPTHLTRRACLESPALPYQVRPPVIATRGHRDQRHLTFMHLFPTPSWPPWSRCLSVDRDDSLLLGLLNSAPFSRQ